MSTSFHGDLWQVGRAGNGDRRGDHGGPSGDRLARRDRGRRTAAYGGARRSGLRTPVRSGPTGRIRSRQDGVDDLPRPASGDELAEELLRLVAAPNLCDKSWITDQYDRYVRGNSVLAQPDDAGMLRIDEDSGLGIALATDCNARFALLDPYAGAQLALAEAYRNVATTGAEPLAITDCLNFGSPEDPAIMWQFSEAIRGLGRRLPDIGYAGHRRKRQLLQPDRVLRRSCQRRSSEC